MDLDNLNDHASTDAAFLEKLLLESRSFHPIHEI